ncbi:hypothetical protein [Vreelandella nigrificans]|uniref:hypothetical protein n=1 Tax=Vreelandella nigrificans TaxID=2042704 RepID=UPI0013FDF49C|nr:hypothetical protein [Halomonas nigrificans]
MARNNPVGEAKKRTKACHPARIPWRQSDIDDTALIRQFSWSTGLPLPPCEALRLGINAGTTEFKTDRTLEGNEYELKHKQRTAIEALVDWYPMMGSGFRVSGGLLFANPETRLEGRRDSQGGYTINGTRYSSVEVGDLRGKVEHNWVAPYLGLGWSRPRPRGRADALPATWASPTMAAAALRWRPRGAAVIAIYAPICVPRAIGFRWRSRTSSA